MIAKIGRNIICPKKNLFGILLNVVEKWKIFWKYYWVFSDYVC